MVSKRIRGTEADKTDRNRQRVKEIPRQKRPKRGNRTRTRAGASASARARARSRASARASESETPRERAGVWGGYD